MHVGTFASMDAAYRRLFDEVRVKGERLDPRGKQCVELRPASFALISPRAGLYTGASRNLNLRFLAIEALGYIAGWGGTKYAQLLCEANRNVRQFVNDDTGEFDGAYGPRLNLLKVVGILERDQHSRQAVTSIWTITDPLVDSKDIPCTTSLQFLYSHGKLDLIVNMRSNDLNWGTPYDVAAFCIVHLAVSQALGLVPGRYHHRVGSLHYYLESPPKVQTPDKESFEIMHAWPPFGMAPANSPLTELLRIQRMADDVLEQAYKLRVVGKNPWAEMPRYDERDKDAEFFAALIRGKEAKA